jgi:hypothetical protein
MITLREHGRENEIGGGEDGDKRCKRLPKKKRFTCLKRKRLSGQTELISKFGIGTNRI